MRKEGRAIAWRGSIDMDGHGSSTIAAFSNRDEPPGSILKEFECREDCEICLGTGHVCEIHPGKPWGATCCDSFNHICCDCGAPGMPCPGGFP